MKSLFHEEQSTDTTTHTKKILALILAIIVYLFLFSPLIIDILPPSWRTIPLNLVPQVTIPQKRQTPAPVKYLAPPQKPQPKKEEKPGILPEKPTEIPKTPPKFVPKKREAETPPNAQPIMPTQPAITQPVQSMPIAKEPTKPEPPHEPIKPVQEPIKAVPSRSSPLPPVPPEKKDISFEKINEKPQRKRTSRSKWFKEQSEDKHNEKTAESKSVSNNIYRHVAEQRYQEQARKTNLSHEGARNKGDPAGDFEINIFNETINRNYCRSSHMNPLFIDTGKLKPHIIIVEVTFTNKRSVSRVNILQPSYDQRINNHVKELFLTMSVPQMPSRWNLEEVTITTSINLSAYPGDKLCFVQNDFWT